MEIPKAYLPQETEDEIYKKWEESNFFNPDFLQTKPNAESFVISMPPPNATGVLHVGHASMLAYEDVMVRYHRMKGDKTLWLPGTDHAAIATQTKVEKLILEKEGKSRHDLGREEFLKRVETFVEESRDTIRKQVRKMGSSCDWSRERYTLDEGLTNAVYEVFIRMYNDGLIYRGDRIVNWCPRCMSTLADDEVKYKKTKSKFYYFKYGPVIIGTARPETKFLDKVIVVHPDDPRYKDIIGKEFDVEWIDGTIKAKVIADKDAADMEIGTGAMTITPAHSFVDFELAQKHNLEVVQIIDEHGNFTKAVPEEFQGKNAREQRDKIVEILKEKGLLHEIDEDYEHNLSMCYRCDTPIEPLVSKQWFIDVNKEIPKRGKSLKELTADPVRNGDIKILPDRFNKTYFQWIDNLRDWCISRQIWFGHRIPVYYCEDCGEVMVAKEKPDQCKSCSSKNIKQDEDTLDTWFSSGLWTFSTLGWPNETEDLRNFHPTSVLETGYDILFFWVARMILMSEYALEEKPFSHVYLHGLVRDEHGQKMSKSLGNIVDPLDMIEQFGTDALRLSMIAGTSPGGDSKLYNQKVENYRNFVNKLWNISRYVLMTVKEVKEVHSVIPQTLSDKWILGELDKVTDEVQKAIEQFSFGQGVDALYEFTWNQLADWYLEIAKVEEGKDEILLYVLDRLLKLWHPYIPFVTEKIYQEMYKGEKMLMIQEFPISESRYIEDTQKEMDFVMSMIKEIRHMRSELKIEPKSKLQARIYLKDSDIESQFPVISHLSRLESLEVIQEQGRNEGEIQLAFGEYILYIQVGDNIDLGKRKTELTEESEKLESYIQNQEKQLSNEDFLSKAPSHIIEERKQSVTEAKERNNQISTLIDQL